MKLVNSLRRQRVLIDFDLNYPMGDISRDLRSRGFRVLNVSTKDVNGCPVRRTALAEGRPIRLRVIKQVRAVHRA